MDVSSDASSISCPSLVSAGPGSSPHRPPPVTPPPTFLPHLGFDGPRTGYVYRFVPGMGLGYHRQVDPSGADTGAPRPTETPAATAVPANWEDVDDWDVPVARPAPVGADDASADAHVPPPTAAEAVCPVVPAANRAPLCRFFLMDGGCRYGARCTFSHELGGRTPDEARKQIPCPYFLQGTCRYGAYCRLGHVRDTAAAAGEEEEENVTTTCGICLEDVAKKSEKHRRFGLLLDCSHCFCLDCLRQWRATKLQDGGGFGAAPSETNKCCPTCRAKSDYIIPSRRFCVGEEKAQVLAAYRAHTGALPCKFFNGHRGSCPFGPDCLYAHRDRHGRDVKQTDRCKKRRSGAAPGRSMGEIDFIRDMLLFLSVYDAGRSSSDDDDDDDDDDSWNHFLYMNAHGDEHAGGADSFGAGEGEEESDTSSGCPPLLYRHELSDSSQDDSSEEADEEEESEDSGSMPPLLPEEEESEDSDSMPPLRYRSDSSCDS